jgi:hypothetical protein
MVSHVTGYLIRCQLYSSWRLTHLTLQHPNVIIIFCPKGLALITAQAWLFIVVMLRWRWKWSIGGTIMTWGKPKWSEKNLSQCHFVRQKSQMDWPRIKAGPSQWQAGSQPPESQQSHFKTWNPYRHHTKIQFRPKTEQCVLLLEMIKSVNTVYSNHYYLVVRNTKSISMPCW